MDGLAVIEKGGDYVNRHSEQMKNARESIDIWRGRRANGLFGEGNKISEIYTDDEKMHIVQAVAQKVVEEDLSVINAIDKLLQSGEIPGNHANSVKILIMRWGHKNPIYKEIIKEARKERAYSLAESIQSLDEDAITTGLEEVDPKIANAFATLHKNRTANIQWLASTVFPEEFSTKMQIAGKIEHLVVQMQIIAPTKKESNG